MGERQFGPYRLIRQLAVGGMAEIHLAKARGIAGFEKYVALKMIHPNFAQDEQFIEMLIDEAKIAVQLQHVNIAQTFDLGRVGETYYITMEYVDGADLYKILRRGSERDIDMPLDLCAFIAKEVATGLDYAHRKRGTGGDSLGIVHRDVSPQNVLVSYAGEVKLVDFGIAKATMKARQTAVGVIKGKYYYMSPEQAWGDPVDHRSDIFSAGIVLYEMLTSQMLYLEEDLQKLLEMVRRAAIEPPSRLRKGIPPQLERIVMNALAKRPEDRYQSAGDFAADLERFLHTYFPVLSSGKLTGHLRKVIGDPAPLPSSSEPGPPPPPEPGPRDPNVSTQPIDHRELLRERSELKDENSVIFRIDDLRRQAEADAIDRSTGNALPRGARGRARAQVATVSLGEIDAADIEERTVVSAPPGFGEPSAESSGSFSDLSDLGDASDFYEPTVIDTAPRREATEEEEEEEEEDEDELGLESYDILVEPGPDEEGPTTTRDASPLRPLSPAADADSAAETNRRGHVERSRRGRPGAPPHPALSARTPTPAVSELRKPRPSRRTPATGTPRDSRDALTTPLRGGSVLQAIVHAHSSDALPEPGGEGPTRPIRGAGAPSDGVPSRLPDGLSTSTAAAPDGHTGAVTAAVPGYRPMPQPDQNGGAVPTGLPLGAPLETFPFGGGPNQPLTFSQQLVALEVDEIPAHLKLRQANWTLRLLLAAALIISVVGALVLIERCGS